MPKSSFDIEFDVLERIKCFPWLLLQRENGEYFWSKEPVKGCKFIRRSRTPE
jgi:hypothetical protein